MALKLALLAVQIMMLLFFATRAVIIRPRSVFGISEVERDGKITTVSEYDAFGGNSTRFRRFYLSSTFIRFVFLSFLGSMLLFALTLIGNLITIDTPRARTAWTNKQPSIELRVVDSKSRKVLAKGPLISTFVVMKNGTVYPVKHSITGIVFVLISKDGPIVINTKSAADFFGVISLFLAIACFVLWLSNRGNIADDS